MTARQEQPSEQPQARAARPSKPNGKKQRGVRFRSRLLKASIPEELTSLSTQMAKLSESGYSPTSITGVGKVLFVLLEHEHTLGMRTFGPMAQFFDLMQQAEDDAEQEEPEEQGASSGRSEDSDNRATPAVVADAG